jgi:hypothetical protein
MDQQLGGDVTTYPKSVYRPLEREQRQPKMARHDLIILHTMVGNLTGTDRMFHANGWTGTESHFGIGGKWADGRDGVVYQWQDTEFQADANLDANRRALSIETGDNAPRLAGDVEPWTPKQLDAIVALVAYLCRTYDIPAVLVPDSRSDRRGIAYHRQGVDHSGGTHPAGFRQAGCERWSTAIGKECPTPARIAQIPGIIERVQDALSRTTKGSDVSFTDRHTLTAADVAAYGSPTLKVGGEKSYDELVRFPPATERLRLQLHARVDSLAAQSQSNGGQLSNLDGAVKAISQQVSRLTTEVTALKGIADQQAKLITDLITLLKTPS